MKGFIKKAAVCLSAFGILLFEASCDNLLNLRVPESVSVKTSAEYSVPLGNASFDVSELLGSDDLLSKLRETLGDEVDLYEFIDTGDDVLTYVMHKSLFDYSLDIGETLGSFDMDSLLESGSGMDGVAIDQEVELPAPVSVSETKSLDFSAVLDDILGKALSAPDPVSIENVPEGFAYRLDEVPADAGLVVGHADVTNPYADFITLAEGSALSVTVTRTDGAAVGSGFEFLLGLDISGTTGVIVSSEKTDVTGGGTITVPLGGKRLPSSFSITPVGSLSGGTSGSLHNYSLSFQFVNAKIASIENLHVDGGTSGDTSDDITVEPFSLEFSAGNVEIPELLESATLSQAGTGESFNKISMYGAMPEGWSGVSVTFDTFDMTGLVTKDKDSLSYGSSGALLDATLDLGGTTLHGGDSGGLSVSATVSVDIDGATLSFGSDGSQNTNLSVSVGGGISKFSEVKIDASQLGGAIPTDPNSHGENGDEPLMSVDLSDIKKFVKAIDFGSREGVGIKAKYSNTLPAGSDLSIKVDSPLLGFNGATLTLAAGNEDEEVSLLSTSRIDFGTADELTFDYYLPSGAITLHDVEMGASYKIALSDLEFVFDWDSAEIDLGGLSGDGDDGALLSIAEDDEINETLKEISVAKLLEDMEDETLKELLGDVFESVELSALDVFLYAKKPEGSLGETLGDLSFTGDLKISSLGEDGKTVWLLKEEDDGDGEKKTLKFLSHAIEWPSSDDVPQISKNGKYGAYLTKEASSLAVSVAELISGKTEGLAVSGSVKLSGASGSTVTIDRATFDEITPETSTTISLDMAVLLPLKLKLKKQLSFSPMQFVYSDEDSENPTDLLGRESASSLEQYADYADMIQYVGVSYSAVNNVIPGLEIRTKITDEASGLDKTLVVRGGSETLRFTGQEAKSVLTSYPFHPEVLVTLGRDYTEAEQEAAEDERVYGEPVELAVSRNAFKSGANALGADVTLTVKMNGDASVTVWGGKEK